MKDQLQRRHFEAIAGIIKGFQMDEIEKQKLAIKFSEELKQYNERFQSDRFITACLTGNMGKGRTHKNVK